MSSRPHLLLINAALAGEAGNTAVVLERLRRRLTRRARVSVLTLAAEPSPLEWAALRPRLREADGFVLGTGTHWDGWSSVLQRFLEVATPAEGTEVWLGKPAACVVTEHSVGGKGVLSRLQGVLVTLGCALPPMSGLVLSRAAQMAVAHDPVAAGDFWCEQDLGIIAHNLLEAVHGTRRWKTWPVDRTDYAARWIT